MTRLGKPIIVPFWWILCQKSTRLVLQLLCVTRGCVWCWEFADCMLPASHIFGKSTLSVPSEAEELFKCWEKAGQDQTLWNLLWNIHGNCSVMAAVWSSVQYVWNKAIQWVILMLFNCSPGESFARGHQQTVFWKLFNSHRERLRGKSQLRSWRHKVILSVVIVTWEAFWKTEEAPPASIVATTIM